MGCAQKADLLEFFDIDVSRDFFHVLSQAPFDLGQVLQTGTVSVLRPHILEISISKSLCFDSFPIIFTDVFRSAGITMSNQQALLQILVFNNYVRPFGFDFFISIDWHVPEDGTCLIFSGVCSYLLSATLMLYCLQILHWM